MESVFVPRRNSGQHASANPVRQSSSIEFRAVRTHFASGESLRLARCGVVRVVVFQAQIREIGDSIVGSVAVEVCNLATFDTDLLMQAETDTASAPGSHQHRVFDLGRQSLSLHYSDRIGLTAPAHLRRRASAQPVANRILGRVVTDVEPKRRV